MDDDTKKNLIKKIKEKKEFSTLAESSILSLIDEYEKKHLKNIRSLNPSEQKIIVKEIRAQLRYFTGQFQRKKKISSLNMSSEEVRQAHVSTSERREGYEIVKKILKEENVRSILDLGCGLNPLVLADSTMKYHAADIQEGELGLIKDFFKRNQISGTIFVCDLRNIKNYNLPQTDITLLFKVLDIVDEKGHKKATEIIDALTSPLILVSFATKKLSGRPMNHPRRSWFETLLNAKKYPSTLFKTENEWFYLIRRTELQK